MPPPPATSTDLSQAQGSIGLARAPDANADPRRHRRRLVFAVLAASLPVALLSALWIGPMDLTLQEILGVIGARLGLTEGTGLSSVASLVVWEIRLPRALLALVVGAGLAMAGAAMQGVFRNPLADPGIIGVATGGAVGGIVMIVLGSRLAAAADLEWFQLYLVPVGAMLGAIAITWLIYRLSLQRGQVDLVAMLLVGIAMNALGNAVIGLMIFIATDEELRTLTFWTLGSLGRASWELILPALLFILPALVLLPRFARALNALLLSEEDAQHLGVDVARSKRRLIVVAAAVVGATVALCGVIGFIALVAPHMIRVVLGPDHRYLFPASALCGALLLLVADLIARTIVAPAELPVGILTALIGAPVFLWLLLQRRRGLWT